MFAWVGVRGRGVKEFLFRFSIKKYLKVVCLKFLVLKGRIV